MSTRPKVSTSEAARALGISERQLRILHEQTPQATIPGAPVDAGAGGRKTLRWDLAQLDTWMRERRALLPVLERLAPPRPAPASTPQQPLPLPKPVGKTKMSLLARAKALNAQTASS